MLDSVDFSGRPFHFIGIGGIGMSALAYVLAKRKLPVSGSDICLSHITQRLEEQGVHIFWSQDATNLEFFQPAPTRTGELDGREPSMAATARLTSMLDGCDPSVQTVDLPLSPYLPQVICSTAINPANSEYEAALEMGCPIFHRSDVLAALMQDYSFSVAVAGTHGKTTTSSMIGYLLLQAGVDPTIVVGGEVKAWEGNAHVGKSPYFVAEADESDGSLVKLVAHLGIITNIELDHPDHYSSLEEVVDIFKVFAQQCQVLVASLDCPTIQQELKPTLSYSLSPDTKADYTATDIVYHASGTTAQIWERGHLLGELNLALLGQHNLSNALAAIAVARYIGLDFTEIAPILSTFEGARRRFERRGEYNHILFVDDYAHHPSEIQATLAAAYLQVASGARQRLVAVFQPHRYSRTQAFLKEFSESFHQADLVITTEIYGASEQNLGLTSGKQLADAIALHHTDIVYQPTLIDVAAYLKEALLPGDLVLFLGAGNLNRIIPELMEYYQQIEQHGTEAQFNFA